MSYLKGVLQEEYERLKALLEKYNDEISALPHGSISIKKRNQKEYVYLAYRQRKNVKFEYIGSIFSEKSKNVVKKVRLRKEYEIKLKQVRKDLKEIEKVINGRKL
jgi:UDP-N-acetylenolpyruvoylglucosamine reductase